MITGRICLMLLTASAPLLPLASPLVAAEAAPARKLQGRFDPVSKHCLRQLAVALATKYIAEDEPLPAKASGLGLDSSAWVIQGAGTPAPKDAAAIDAGAGDFIYNSALAGKRWSAAANLPIACEKPGLWADGHVNVLKGDGSVVSLKGDFKTPEDVFKAASK
ncbi:MAG: hypothetical protein RL095_2886 [Verrucomicrobiota bacterium]|jgi:hypothetical protein